MAPVQDMGRAMGPILCLCVLLPIFLFFLLHGNAQEPALGMEVLASGESWISEWSSSVFCCQCLLAFDKWSIWSVLVHPLFTAPMPRSLHRTPALLESMGCKCICLHFLSNYLCPCLCVLPPTSNSYLMYKM